jgi:hypothetical protein
MATRMASNGYLRIGGSVVTKALELQIQSSANAEYVVTLAGDSGPTTGIKTVKASVKNAVARASAERKRIMRAYQNNEAVNLTYRSGDMEYKAEGIITDCTLGSKVNSKDEFDFEFMGTEQPIVDV